jgi:hypothetical protein
MFTLKLRRKKENKKLTAFFFLPKHWTDWLIMLKLIGDAWVKTFAENAPDDAPVSWLHYFVLEVGSGGGAESGVMRYPIQIVHIISPHR